MQPVLKLLTQDTDCEMSLKDNSEFKAVTPFLSPKKKQTEMNDKHYKTNQMPASLSCQCRVANSKLKLMLEFHPTS